MDKPVDQGVPHLLTLYEPWIYMALSNICENSEIPSYIYIYIHIPWIIFINVHEVINFVGVYRYTPFSDTALTYIFGEFCKFSTHMGLHGATTLCSWTPELIATAPLVRHGSADLLGISPWSPYNPPVDDLNLIWVIYNISLTWNKVILG